MIGGVLFLVIKMKLGHDNIAQLFLELLRKPEFPLLRYAELVYSGRRNNTFEGLRVHGLLTDIQAFHFYSYDPSRRKSVSNETLQASAPREMSWQI